MTDESLRALPRGVPDYHARQAAHLRALAANASTGVNGRFNSRPGPRRKSARGAAWQW